MWTFFLCKSCHEKINDKDTCWSKTNWINIYLHKAYKMNKKASFSNKCKQNVCSTYIVQCYWIANVLKMMYVSYTNMFYYLLLISIYFIYLGTRVTFDLTGIFRVAICLLLLLWSVKFGRQILLSNVTKRKTCSYFKQTNIFH